MKILLKSDNPAVLSIVEICCERAGFDRPKTEDEGEFDLVIKDCNEAKDLTDDDKTLFLLPKNLENEAKDIDFIIKPFLPTELIKFLKNYKNRNNPKAVFFNEDEIKKDEKNNEDEIKKENLQDETISLIQEEKQEEIEKISSLIDEIDEMDDLDIDDDIPLDELANKLEKDEDILDDLVQNLDDDISLDELANELDDEFNEKVDGEKISLNDYEQDKDDDEICFDFEPCIKENLEEKDGDDLEANKKDEILDKDELIDIDDEFLKENENNTQDDDKDDINEELKTIPLIIDDDFLNSKDEDFKIKENKEEKNYAEMPPKDSSKESIKEEKLSFFDEYDEVKPLSTPLTALDMEEFDDIDKDSEVKDLGDEIKNLEPDEFINEDFKEKDLDDKKCDDTKCEDKEVKKDINNAKCDDQKDDFVSLDDVLNKKEDEILEDKLEKFAKNELQKEIEDALKNGKFKEIFKELKIKIKISFKED